MRRILATVFGSLLLILVGSAHAQVATGDIAPLFTLMDTNGQEVSLDQYKGKFVVLEWFNYDCPFVVKHYSQGNMQGLQKKYTAKDVVWLAINSSAEGKQGHYPPEQMNALAKERGAAPTAILLDPTGKVGQMYGAKTTPHMFVIDPKGAVVYQGAIDDKPSADPADIATSVNFLSKALDEAMAGKAVEQTTTKSYGCSVKY